MSYPTSLPIAASSAQVDYQSDRQIDRATNGAAKGRVFYTAAKREFAFTHPGLSAAEVATFVAFFSANLDTAFDFYWPGDGVTYTCLFAREPAMKMLGSGLTEISVQLAEA